ncbi:MAG: helix-turn-helix domain-containing protein [Treponema sp.]|jgi:transcriptional regulator with XRE-family HTH domain|nr:helix-turn-helix domain-containing protein [Treponema sp.]
MDIQKILVTNIRKWRKQEGISQGKLAELCGTASCYIRQIETGRKCPSLNYIGKIATALNVAPHQLFYYDAQLEEGIMADERILQKKAEEKSLIARVSEEIHASFDKLS